MDETVQRFLHGIEVGAKQHYRNMTLHCLLAARDCGVDFLTLDAALDKQALTITEVSEGGSVPQLRVVNKSNQKVLLIDGEELAGAKQNRVLNVTVLIAPLSETIIPVSCVEQRRWSYKDKEFRSESRAMSPRMKQKKTESVRVSLDMDDSFRADQGLVWDEVEAKYARMATPVSPTLAMADLYESHRHSADDYLQAFHSLDNQIGMIVFIDGKVAGMEMLGTFSAFASVHRKLVHSYVMDALETVVAETEDKTRNSQSEAAQVLESAENASVQKRQSVALGQDIRFESNHVVGAGLEFEGQVLQMSIFLQTDQSRGTRRGAMRRASQRRASRG